MLTNFPTTPAKKLNCQFFSQKSLRSFPDDLIKDRHLFAAVEDSANILAISMYASALQSAQWCSVAMLEDAARRLSHWCSSCSQHMPGIQDVPYKISHGKMKVIWLNYSQCIQLLLIFMVLWWNMMTGYWYIKGTSSLQKLVGTPLLHGLRVWGQEKRFSNGSKHVPLYWRTW